MTSAEAGHPFMPLEAETTPSFTCAFAVSEGSSGCSMIRTSRSLLYSNAVFSSFASHTGEPSSVNITAPDSAIRPSSASCLPCRPLLTHPEGSTRAPPARFPRARRYSTVTGLSTAGSVFGIVTTVEYPPAAAARAPLSVSSRHSYPGSRK